MISVIPGGMFVHTHGEKPMKKCIGDVTSYTTA